MFDLLIVGGKVLDGTGSPWFWADVAVKEGKIARVGHLAETAARRLDAKGQVVCPGFVDIHTHSDLTVLSNPRAESKVQQGVTTEVIGNCGLAPAPVAQARAVAIRQAMALLDLDPQVEWRWESIGDYLDVLRSRGCSINLAPLIGHVALRASVVGFEDRPANPKEIREMQRLIEEGMHAGAFGLSTGLVYPPGCYATTEELIALARTVAGNGGLYASHIRDYADTFLEAVRETLGVAEQSGASLQISHHVSVGRRNWPKVRQSLELLSTARTNGMDVTVDVYPYAAGSANLSQLLPGWVHAGGADALVERLQQRPLRERIREEWKTTQFWEWENIVVSWLASPKNQEVIGKHIADLAAVLGREPEEVYFDLIVEESNAVNMVEHLQAEENVRLTMAHPLACFGSDGWAVAPYGPLGRGRPHPRYYGAFPRVLGKYVREERVLRLEEAICKMTSFPARKLGLYDRGLIREGMAADLVVFDPERIADQATYDAPHQFPRGIAYVIVNGTVTVQHGQHTGAMTGTVLRPA